MRIPKKPIEKTFDIYSEEFGNGTVTIRQARTGDDIRRKELVSEASWVVSDNLLEQEIKQKINPANLHRYDIFLTMTACSFELEGEKEGDIESFKFANGRLNDQAHFERLYNLLPMDVSEQIYEKVLSVNPMWGNVPADLGE